YFGKDQEPICMDCLWEMTQEGNICPVCGYQTKEEDKEVALLLAPADSTPEQKKNAPKVICTVCPRCRVVYFDKLAYGIMQAMRNQDVIRSETD
ncbi:MAG: hypothetical protein ACOC4Y_02455, partial [bacterium]